MGKSTTISDNHIPSPQNIALRIIAALNKDLSWTKLNILTYYVHVWVLVIYEVSIPMTITVDDAGPMVRDIHSLKESFDQGRINATSIYDGQYAEFIDRVAKIYGHLDDVDLIRIVLKETPCAVAYDHGTTIDDDVIVDSFSWYIS